MKVKVISLPYVFQVLFVLYFTRPGYQVSVYRTIGPLVSVCQCLLVLRLNVPVNNVYSHVGTEPPLPGYYQYFQGVKCLAQEHNTAEVGFDPLTSRSEVRCSTTDPPRSPYVNECQNFCLPSDTCYVRCKSGIVFVQVYFHADDVFSSKIFRASIVPH